MKPAGVILAGAAALAAGHAPVASAQIDAPGTPVLDGLQAIELPADLSAAADVRWRDVGGFLIGLRRNGVYSWQPGNEAPELVATLAGQPFSRASRYGDHSRIGSGGGDADSLIFGGDLFGVWRLADGRATALKANVEIVGDLDQQGEWAVAVGLARRPDPGQERHDVWEPHIAWMLDAAGDVKGLLPTRDGGKALDACFPVEPSVSRFVGDGLVLVVPGAEPGAYLYDANRALQAVVDLEALDIGDLACGDQERDRLDQEDSRAAWLGQHRFIDEVVANDRGDVFLFVRHVLAQNDGPAATSPATGVASRLPATPAPNPAPDDDENGGAVSTPAGGAAADRTVVSVKVFSAGQASTASPGTASPLPGNPETLAANATAAGAAIRSVAFSVEEFKEAGLQEVRASAGGDGPIVLTRDQADRLRELIRQRDTASVHVADASAADIDVPGSPAPGAPQADVCWDIVHARVEDLQATATATCAVRSNRADARLRADLSGDRLVLLLRGATRLAGGDHDRPAQLFQARLRAGDR